MLLRQTQVVHEGFWEGSLATAMCALALLSSRFTILIRVETSWMHLVFWKRFENET